LPALPLAPDAGRDLWEQGFRISLLGVNILLHQPAEVLAAAHAAAGSGSVHGIYEFPGRTKRQGNKLFAFLGDSDTVSIGYIVHSGLRLFGVLLYCITAQVLANGLEQFFFLNTAAT
jgi:hypothetical protein